LFIITFAKREKVNQTLKNAFKCLAIVIFSFALTHASSDSNSNPIYEVRKINPPKLDTAHLGEKILCHRPMRRGSPKMEVELQGNKVIAHNYGHGGSGWTLGPGCAEYVTDLLEQSPHSSTLTQETLITVIGAGALGFFSAYKLIAKGYKNITIVAENFDSLTSHNAGGLLAPVSMDNNPAMQKIITKVGIDAYKFYASIAQKEHPDFKEGAIIVPTYFNTREDSGLEPYVGTVMQPAKDVLLDFGTGQTQQVVAYDDGIFIDTATMMTQLTNYLQPRATFINQKVTDFAAIKDDYIVNCSGLGAQELTGDNDLVSVQGHLIMLKDQNPQDLQHMILVYFNEGKTKSGQKAKRSFYMFPKKLPGTGINDVGVIGGTFIEGATNRTPNEEEFDSMLDGAKTFYGIK
jgi:D-amino-acid oxidase